MSKRIAIAKLDYLIWSIVWWSDEEGYVTTVEYRERATIGEHLTVLKSERFTDNPFGGDAANAFVKYCDEALRNGSRSMSLDAARRKGVEI